MSGHYLVPLMRASADRLEPIIKRLNPVFDANTRGSLLMSYALLRETIGEQAGSNEDLPQAIAALRAALQEWTRERVPLQWAMIQNNFGPALRTLGGARERNCALGTSRRGLLRPAGMDARARAAPVGHHLK